MSRRKQRPSARAGAPGAAILLALSLPCCGAPPAVPLKGEAADAVKRGIAGGTGTMDHSRFDRVLKDHARREGALFDYAGLQADPEDLDAYLEEAAGADLASLSRNELLALLINAYNAYTIRSILETLTPQDPGGVASIRDIPDVFDRKVHVVGGFRLSLNNLEHNLIRPLFRDPRIHFAVNCASISCAPLPPDALTGERVDDQLEQAARRTLSSPAYVRVEKGRLLVTKLLDWYGSDFVTPGFRGAEPTLDRFVHQYASDDVRRWLDSSNSSMTSHPTILFLDYDWSLNKAD